MTSFDRSGHYRTNQNGTTFWVSGHSVSRDDWPFGVPRPVMRVYGHEDAVAPSRNITIPNARCPRCQQPVFFFMAANGGRVFFDELGPPWPKHPCTVASDAVVLAFMEADAIIRWQQGRRSSLGLSIPDGDLAVRPGCTRGTARIVRRQGKVVAVVETIAETLAFEVDHAWQGRSSKTVYFRQVEPPEVPVELEYLSVNLDVIAIEILDAVEVPTHPSSADFPSIAATAMDETEAWMQARLPAFVPGPRLKLAGHAVGIAGRIGYSRAVLLPLAAFFEADEDDWLREDAEKVKSAKRQVREWTRRIVRMLDRSERTRKNAVYRDVFIWLVPERTQKLDLERAIRAYARDVRSLVGSAGGLGPPATHVVQPLGNDVEQGACETRFGLDEFVPGERKYLAEGFKRQVEKRWLAAILSEGGLDLFFSRLKREGVRFQFMGTTVRVPEQWGQQALLPDGRRLLVLLHLSSPEQGLAFVYFGAPVKGKYGQETYQADAIFHAKRLAAILKYLETEMQSV